MKKDKKYQRELTSLSDQDSFLVMDRNHDTFGYPIHFHPEMELNFIANGKGMLRTVGYTVEEIDDFDLVLLGSNVYHGWDMHKCPHPVHEITIQFHPDLFGPSLMRKSLMKPLRDMFSRAIHGILFDPEEVKKIAPRLLNLSSMGGISSFLELFSILYDLSNTPNQVLVSSAERPLGDFENSDKVKLLYNYIQENYQRRISLSEVADLLNISKVSFNRFIKKISGQTFVEYLNEVRVDHAAKLLIGTDYSIAEIAYRCGFNNIANYNRFFKKTKKLTPSAYRKKFYGQQNHGRL